MPYCATCGVFLRVGPAPGNTRGMQLHTRAALHWAAERGHRLTTFHKPGYGSRWKCSCGAEDEMWRSKRGAFRSWLAHVGHPKAERARVPQVMPPEEARRMVG